MSKTLHGRVSVQLEDETFELVPTLLAVQRIEDRFGGLRGAANAIHSLSVGGIAHIIASGAGLTGKAADQVAEKVWQAGVVEVSIQVTPYIQSLFNPRGDDLGKAPPGKE